ncbi:MAG: energy-coupling factor transporter transmembrane protein EcfT [Defluviitaleaceae bacterium]|nr:energy-coupling factor transporter transmembrane protein EcfT [Defluviitaleaceae bacterium]
MKNRIAIGQYYPADSPVHALDPRVKLAVVIVFVTALFFVQTFYGYIAAALGIAAVVRVSSVPPKLLLRGLRGILFLLVFMVVLNIFFTPGATVILSFHMIQISREGIILAAKMALRLTLLITGSTLLTLTTSPIQLTDAIEFFLKPFKKIGLPAHEIAMMMTIALRFIPTLIEETDKIMKAQMARGADFDTGGIIKKAKSLIPLLVPLFVSAFRRADELAMAMEARCYRGDVGRTRMKEMKLVKRDWIAAGIFVGFVVIMVGMNIL